MWREPPTRRRCANPLCARPLPAPLFVLLAPDGRRSFCDLPCLLEWAALTRVRLRAVAERADRAAAPQREGEP